jgi:hypothetical protein
VVSVSDRRWSTGSTPKLFWELCLVGIVVALLMVPDLGSTTVAGISERESPSRVTSASTIVSAGPDYNVTAANLTINSTAIDLSPLFWGSTISPRSRLLPNEGTLVNATPTEVVVWPGGVAGDDYDPMTDTMYNDRGVGSKPTTSEAQFVAWCKSIVCQAIVQIPAETESWQLALAVINYTERNLSFEPAYWEIGNEPELWTHTGIPWTSWNESQYSPLNQYAYASLVQEFISKIRPYYPTIRFIGIAATGRPNHRAPLDDWIKALVAVDGPNISAVAYHSYPAGRGTVPDSLPYFFASINGSAGLMGRVSQVRAGLAAGASESPNPTCQATCAQSIQIFVTEVGSGLSHNNYFNHWSVSFPGALDLAAQMTQAMDLDLPNQDLFGTVSNTANSWFSLVGAVRPDYTLYSEILSHLGTVAYPVNLTLPVSCRCTGSNLTLGSDLYGIATVAPASHERADLMLVNLNLTTGASVRPELPGVAPGTPVELWTWSGNISNSSYTSTSNSTHPAASTPAPVPVFFPNGLPANWTLAPQTVALFESYPEGGVPVEFRASGFLQPASPPRWNVEVGGALATANATSNLTLFLPPGTYPLSAPAIPLNNGSALTAGNNELFPKERLEPYLPASFTLGTTPVTVPIDFAHQWWTNVTATPVAGGYVTPQPEWVNASQPVTLTAGPAFHYSLAFWEGYRNGSVNSTAPQVTIDPSTWISEKAVFAWSYPVTFTETGLPSGTAWSITVRSHFALPGSSGDANTSVGSITDTIGVEEANGSYGFEIGSVAGYRASVDGSSYLTNSSFNVSGAPADVAVAFFPLTPPAPRFAVLFVESGLPRGSRWSVTSRNVTSVDPVGNSEPPSADNLTETSDSNTILFDDSNGSYGYTVSSIPGYRAHPPAFGFAVEGPGLVISVQFAPVLYDVVWNETGLGSGVNWFVLLSNQTWVESVQNVGAWTSAHLANGTYTYAVPDAASFLPQVRDGTFVVAGANVTFPVRFSEVHYEVEFRASDPLAGTSWEVRLSDSTTTSRTSLAGFGEPNGSYTFDVLAPSGYLALPSHGTITVDATPVTVNVSFVPNAVAAVPPLSVTAIPAGTVTLFVGIAAVGVYFLGRSRSRAYRAR